MRRGSGPSHRHGKLTSAQLSPKTWPDFEELFASNGGVWGGCWCMYYHKPGKFDSHQYDANRDAKKSLTEEGKAHGTIVYCAGTPVGWVQFGPMRELQRIDSRRGYAPTAPSPWRVTCLFIAPGHRKLGVGRFGVAESVKAMRRAKAGVIEAYPVEGRRSSTLLWMGTPGLFEGAGFTRAGPFGKNSWVYSLALGGRPEAGKSRR